MGSAIEFSAVAQALQDLQAATTSHGQRRVAEQKLICFQESPDCWRISYATLTNFQFHQCHLFCAQSLQRCVERVLKRASQPRSDRSEVCAKQLQDIMQLFSNRTFSQNCHSSVSGVLAYAAAGAVLLALDMLPQLIAHAFQSLPVPLACSLLRTIAESASQKHSFLGMSTNASM